MTQLLQNIYAIAPYVFVLVLLGATFGGVWLIAQLRKSSGDNLQQEHYSVADRMFMKRNAARLRNIEFH
ncbi:hypothetical protein [Dyadobacter sp. CY326]|uniref:hypothetical protein n=1 Tax=Dyadobacter sp. CY326 TaxID=2907300 RepID=UPI001F2D61E2|nr:hypothetical protein [Dyadobacter sp. CY326]MCE7064199.1 hypothetical protein [Dyadobacter sp. CY326]